MGQVVVGGSALPGVRVELNPQALNKYGIGLEQVRTVLAAANANTPKGHFSDGHQMWEVGANDQIFKAVDYKPLLIAYHNGAAVRVSDVGDVVDSVEDLRNAGYCQRQALRAGHHLPPAGRQHHRYRGSHPRRAAAAPGRHSARPSICSVAMDQTQTIRASVHDVERTLLISVGLVVLVVFVFLQERAQHLHSQRRRSGLAARAPSA